MAASLQPALPLSGQGNNMNTPPNPPSPADDDVRKRRAALLRHRIVQQLKRTYPGLPY
ncbi:hypothetical protein [Pusillimonas caeni]|uniref:hypothetical protein n=1 Tax=Pusillimonas caeni TaxID=1348472 RepID=UPI001431297F|nr:hypothetical protein [Pusillimonas caeni]